MMLFKSDEIKLTFKPYQKLNHVQYNAPTSSLFLSERAPIVIQKIVDDFDFEKQIDFVSYGQFSLHNLVVNLVKKFGQNNTKIYFTAWAIKPEPAQAIIDLKRNGLVSEIYAVLDHRVKSQERDSFELLKQHLNAYCLKNIHAKVVVIDFGIWKTCINTSANFTRNTRIETGYITSNNYTGSLHQHWIEETIKEWTLQQSN